MKKISFILTIVLLLLATVVFAREDLMILDEPNVPYADEPEYIALDNDILISSMQDENIMILDNEINATGTANDLIMLLGSKVTSNAQGNHAFIISQDLDLSGAISRDSFVIAETLNLNGQIGRDLYAVGSTINIDGEIGGDANLISQKLFISKTASIFGNVNVSASEIIIEDGATIYGTVNYNDDASVTIPSSIKTTVTATPQIENTPNENPVLIKIKGVIFSAIVNIILFAITMLIAPLLFERISNANKNKGAIVYATSLGWGLLFLFLIPILSLIALMTIVGISFGAAGFLLYFIIMIYSTVLVGYSLGTLIFKSKEIDKYFVGIIGIIILSILKIVPVIGGWVSFGTILIAYGIVKEIMKKENKEIKEEN